MSGCEILRKKLNELTVSQMKVEMVIKLSHFTFVMTEFTFLYLQIQSLINFHYLFRNSVMTQGRKHSGWMTTPIWLQKRQNKLNNNFNCKNLASTPKNVNLETEDFDLMFNVNIAKKLSHFTTHVKCIIFIKLAIYQICQLT